MINIKQIFTIDSYSNSFKCFFYVNVSVRRSVLPTYYIRSDQLITDGHQDYMRLEAGDTISLRTARDGNGLYEITLYFELAQLDSVPQM